MGYKVSVRVDSGYFGYFFVVKFPKITDNLTLRRKYNGAISEVMIDFMEGCLELDPIKRYTINECLQHRAFRSIQQESRLQQQQQQQQPRKQRYFFFFNFFFFYY